MSWNPDRPGSGRPLAGGMLLTGRLRALAEAQRPHVLPDRLDVGQANVLGSAGTLIRPAGGVLPIPKPDRVLLLGVDHHLVERPLVALAFLVAHRPRPAGRRPGPLRKCRATGNPRPGTLQVP